MTPWELGAVALVILVCWGWLASRKPVAPPVAARPAQRWPALAMRDRLGWRELREQEDGYGPGLVAVVHCRSRQDQNRVRYLPELAGGCLERSLRHGGERACSWACLGAGDCVAACGEGAIRLEGGLPVVDPSLCTGCGDCLPACPVQVLGLQPAEARLVVACQSDLAHAERPGVCQVACAGHGACLETRFVAPGLVERRGNRPALRHDHSANLLPLLSLCPTGSFVDRAPHRPWFTVNEHCTACGDCLPLCPAPGCILPAGGPADTPVGTSRVRIVAEVCTGCGLCLPACQPQAIRVVGALGYGGLGARGLGARVK